MHFAVILAALEVHLVRRAVLENLDGKPPRQRVGDRRSHAVQTARVRVVVVAELAACVKLGENDFHAAHFHRGVNVYRYASAVVLHADRAVGVHGYADSVAVTVRHLVHAVVDDFPQNMVKSSRSRRADIHARAHSDRVKPLEDLYILCVVIFPCHVSSVPSAPTQNKPESAAWRAYRVYRIIVPYSAIFYNRLSPFLCIFIRLFQEKSQQNALAFNYCIIIR